MLHEKLKTGFIKRKSIYFTLKITTLVFKKGNPHKNQCDSQCCMQFRYNIEGNFQYGHATCNIDIFLHVCIIFQISNKRVGVKIWNDRM